VADEFSGAVIEALTVRKGEVSCFAPVLPPIPVLCCGACVSSASSRA